VRIVVAPDAFKGTLSAGEAAAAMAEGIREILPDAEVIELPLADGGEGTAEILASYLPDGVCLIESAQLIGLHKPWMQALDVMQRGSATLGRAILTGLNEGKRDFVIALGGSATNDGGLGMLMALGLHALDTLGEPVEPNLAGLLSLASIDISGLDPRLNDCRITVLSDVLSPLCGNSGATAVYGPQKGVNTDEVGRIDVALAVFADLCAEAFGSDPRDQAGAGAAGGLGFALMLLGGEAVSGAGFVIEACGFTDAIADADWVITGEGCSDMQTLAGKLPLIVARLARQHDKRVAILSGMVDSSAGLELSRLADCVLGAGDTIPATCSEACQGLRAAAVRLARTLAASA